MSIILANKVLEAMEEAGIIRREDRIRRVVIDLAVGEVATIHVERYGDEKLLSVVPSLVGVEIRREESTPAEIREVAQQDDQEFVKALRKVVRDRGGNVQAVLGS